MTQETSSLRVRLYEGANAFGALGPAWDALVELQSVPNPTMGSTWLRALAAWEPGVPLLVLVESAEQLLAGAAFGVRRPARVGGPRVATWLGTRNYWYSPDVLVDPGSPEAGVAVIDAVLGYADALELPAPAEGLVAQAIRRLAPAVEQPHLTDGWVMPLPPERLKSASKRAAYEVRRATRRGAVIDITVARQPREIEPVLERAFELHRARWRNDPLAIRRFSSRRADREWYRRTLRAMAEQDRVRMIEVTEGGQPVGAVIGLHAGAGSMCHMLVGQRRGHLTSPGHVALLHWVTEAVSDGSTVMDLCWGAGSANSPKARFRPEHIPIVEFRCAARARDRRFVSRLADLRRYRTRAVQLARQQKAVAARALSGSAGTSAE